MNFDTIQFSHIWDEATMSGLPSFLSRAAFVISHKDEPIEELVGVLWHLPAQTTILVVSNCPVPMVEVLQRTLPERLPRHSNLYLIHQKDPTVAGFFQERGVHQILDDDAKVRNGKGEGMYIGTLGALLLGHPEWIIFFDADNLVPSALLEYKIAMSRLFLAQQRPTLHNVRIFWASKPALKEGGKPSEQVLGRCSRVVSQVINTLLQDRFGLSQPRMMVSNAGEQGLSISAARTLRFSSGYSVETFQLLELLALAMRTHPQASDVLLQQYEAKAPHFHEKGDEEHIKLMIAQSLGSFYHFEGQLLTEHVQREIERIMGEFDLLIALPRVYPALNDLYVQQDVTFMARYRLSQAQGRRADDGSEEEVTRAS